MIQPLARGPTAILSMYISGACSRQPFGAMAITAIAPGCPLATKFVPSTGSTAISTSGPPQPTFSPIYSIGASSISPSPITTVPLILTVSNIFLMASTASWSAPFLSPRPTLWPQAMAAASVTRTNSIDNSLFII
ncbi:hypothetical protein SDC9_107290 [bioreactor metagenome]|uniref:Uncharacterized protein n=1 Tax=bioreactor metagenome TaxID=1076179 RepID=A0A645B4S4_9ZZZZ